MITKSSSVVLRLLLGVLLSGASAPAHAQAPTSTPPTLGMIADNSSPTFGSGSAVIFDADSLSVVGFPIFVGQQAKGCAVNAAGTLGFMTSSDSQPLVVDLPTSESEGPSFDSYIQISNSAESTSLTLDGKFVVTCGGNLQDPSVPAPVSVINMALRREVSTKPLKSLPPELPVLCTGVEVCRDGSVLTIEAQAIHRWTIDSEGTLNDAPGTLRQAKVINVTCAPDSKFAIALLSTGDIVSFTVPGLGTASLPLAQAGLKPVAAVFDPTETRVFILSSQKSGSQLYSYAFAKGLLYNPTRIDTPGRLGQLLSFPGVDEMALSPDGTLLVSQSSVPGSSVPEVTILEPDPPNLTGRIQAVSGPAGICLPPVPLATYLSTCGNGHPDELPLGGVAEQCDDGNTVSGDGCSSRCEVELCYTCTGKSCKPSAAGTPCVDDGFECTDDVCDGSGRCGHLPTAAGTPCMDDGNKCANHVCDGFGICGQLLPDGSSCDDGLYCNGHETCQNGTCISAPAKDHCSPTCSACSEEHQGACEAPPQRQGYLCNEFPGCSLHDDICQNGVCSGPQTSQPCDLSYVAGRDARGAPQGFTLDRVTLHATRKNATSPRGTIKVRGKVSSTAALSLLPSRGSLGLGLTVSVLDSAGNTVDTLTWKPGMCYGFPGAVEYCTHNPDKDISAPEKAVLRPMREDPKTYSVTITASHRKIGNPLMVGSPYTIVQTDPAVRVTWEMDTPGLKSRDDIVADGCTTMRGNLGVDCRSTAGAVCPSSGNLLIDGGFEDPSLAAWTTDSFGSATLVWDTTQAYKGTNSVEISAAEFTFSGWIQTVPVRRPGKYQLSGWIKTSNVTPPAGSSGGASLSIFQFPSSSIISQDAPLLDTNDWTYFKLTFDSHTDKEITVGAFLDNSIGTAWFDDLQLAQLTKCNQ